MRVGEEWESTLMSVGVSMCDENACCDGHVNSPARMKPKKPRQNAAHSITLSNVNGPCDHVLWICLSISGVIGSRRPLVRGGPSP